MNDLSGQSFTWTARDNVMNKIDAGDTVKLDKTSAAQSGDLVLADVNGAIVVRRLIQKDGVTMLRADNPDYEDFFNPKFQILGVAVSVREGASLNAFERYVLTVSAVSSPYPVRVESSVRSGFVKIQELSTQSEWDERILLKLAG